MAMTVAESLSFVNRFQALVEDILEVVDVVLCPPFTALYPVAQALRESRLGLGAQNIASSADQARTGEISTSLLVDVGCRWVMLGHWEVRRYLGDDDAIVNRKVHRALAAGLNPLLLVGPESGEVLDLPDALANQLNRVLAGCEAEQVTRMAFVFEPEASIGQDSPADAEMVAEGCRLIRGWLGQTYGHRIAEKIRILYGGSVAPEFASDLLASPDIDGLGTSRRGRDPASFAEIVRLVYRIKNPSSTISNSP
jgi:triosephosphate isomerase